MPILTSVTLGKFCREIAGGLSPLEVLLQEWNVTQPDFERLKQSEGFKHEMAVILAEMRELGADAGYIYRMKSLAEEHIPELVKIMDDAATGVGTRVDIIKFVADMARVKEKPQSKEQQGGVRGPSVVFHFGAGLPVKSMTVTHEPVREQMPAIEVMPKPADEYGFNLVRE